MNTAITVAIASLLLLAAPIATADHEPENEHPPTQTPGPLKYCVDIITSTTPPTIRIYPC